MKFIMIMILSFTTASFAADLVQEFDEQTEVKCYLEAKKLNCVPGAGEADNECVEAKKAKLSSICLKLHNSKKR